LQIGKRLIKRVKILVRDRKERKMNSRLSSSESPRHFAKEMSQFNTFSIVPKNLDIPSAVSVGGPSTGTSEFGVHDSLREGLVQVKKSIQGQHPLEARLNKVPISADFIFFKILKRTSGSEEHFRLNR
jgi:hypothetical protein